VLHCVPLSGSRGRLLQFHSFDDNYLGRLRDGDFLTQDHFRKYFTALMKVKLQSRLKSPEAIEDVQQETFVRFYAALREGKIREPKSLGSYVNSVCNNVLKESWRHEDPAVSLDDDGAPELPAACCAQYFLKSGTKTKCAASSVSRATICVSYCTARNRSSGTYMKRGTIP